MAGPRRSEHRSLQPPGSPRERTSALNTAISLSVQHQRLVWALIRWVVFWARPVRAERPRVAPPLDQATRTAPTVCFSNLPKLQLTSARVKGVPIRWPGKPQLSEKPMLSCSCTEIRLAEWSQSKPNKISTQQQLRNV